jgi:hypothetical protein
MASHILGMGVYLASSCRTIRGQGTHFTTRPYHHRVMRRFPPPWTVEKIAGGLKVVDANGQSLAYVYSREKPDDPHMAKVLTEDEARRIAANIAKLPSLLAKS